MILTYLRLLIVACALVIYVIEGFTYLLIRYDTSRPHGWIGSPVRPHRSTKHALSSLLELEGSSDERRRPGK